uniref:RING-type E3 ubiquitin transferase n=1 Tax=Geotrypetes seraphini TaxID=260995 RepID=A0A6P8P1M8_GEOSA|nr:E3 ubiquitin-protein ligase SH3RF2 [Geotrypetes seraphini]XP_033782821.1 E3 ubiquitin-protein ligase SH3RF2 [Geotrypetes seraphini]XP_033782822.1 E3 ubiquitin-protein ligase SH3RF2 [Geotrypetes seraphini]XP_033782823.1 E3 ubiquitin-protein ligase SH3RF2 [Geotrypetes seraphini]XP_033782824.1 E3 ubiquitin-protein ligase SH3RF2 [Geotrypetes seraphini]
MDDLSVLDLLRCPVCFEKLDVTAKVLPCQHTFCKPCLQRVFAGRKELRCPECRTPVFCNIEELPANLLLVRLLDGIRGGQAIVRVNSLRRSGGVYAQDSFSRTLDPKGLRPASSRLIQNARMPMDGVPCARALYNYRGHMPKDLRLSKGDVIILHQHLDENWSQGQADGVGGTFPAGSVQMIKPFPQPPPLCKALYNFDLKDKDKGENNHFLAFLKDDIIRVIRRIDENWVEGKLGDRVGIFPLLFVELNLPARHLLDTGKSIRSSTLNSTTSLVRNSSIRAKPTELPAFRKVQDMRRKSPRQFLITNALNTINKMVHAPEDRQSPDISAPVLISSSNPAALAPGTDKGELASTSPSQFNAPTFAISGVLSQSSTTFSLSNSQQHISANMCVALHPYIAQGPEEMDLQKGEGIRVLGKFQEGWLRGMSLVTGKTGVFPSNYVNPVFRRCQTVAESRIPTVPSARNMSTASVSSQGSVSDNGPCRHFRSVFVPTAVIAPVRNTAVHGAPAQAALRRGCGSMKKSASLQRGGQPSSMFQMAGSLKRTPSAVVRPQPVQQQKGISQANSAPPGPVETAARPNATHDSLALVARGSEMRVHSAGSSAIIDVKELVAKNELPLKPPGSAPPSILVKPDTSKNSTEKQVKTVRFQACSPPVSKRDSTLSVPGIQNGRTDPVAPETTLPDQDGSPELPAAYHLQGCSSSVQQKENRRPQLVKALSFPTKRNSTEN